MENQDQPLTKKQRRELKRQDKLEQRQKEQTKKKTSKIITWISVLVIAIGGIYFLTTLGGGTTTILTDSVSDSDHVKGNIESDVILLEYSDFQCPACASYYETVKQIVDEFQNDIRFVYRHYPLRSIHQNAQEAAEASEAAGMQDKFWEMHDKLFENQDSWADEGNPTDTFISYAEELELDIEKFKIDFDSSTVKDIVNSDYTSGTASNVTGTPTFYLNGEKITSPRGYDEFKAVILSAIGDTPSTDESTGTNTEATNTEEDAIESTQDTEE